MNYNIILIITLILFFSIISFFIYSTFKKLKTYQTEALAIEEILDTMTHKRFELIPKLLNIATHSMPDAKEIIDAIRKARVSIIGAISDKEKLEAENSLSENLKKLFSNTTNYNKATQTLLHEIQMCDMAVDQIKISYNEIIEEYNHKIQKFPNNLIAKHFKITQKTTF